MIQDEVLTIKNVAAIPKIAEETVCSRVPAGKLPAFEIRGVWRVRRDDVEDVDDWVERQARGRIGKSAPPKP